MENYRHKVQYYETDQMKIVHHSNYIRWFEEARTDLLEKLGMGYERMEEEGIISPVCSVSCNYRSMTHFGDTVEIVCRIVRYNGIRLKLSYCIQDAVSGEIRAEGSSEHCFLDREGNILSLKRANPACHALLEEQQEK